MTMYITPSRTPTQADTSQSAVLANPRPYNKTTAKWARKVDNHHKAKVMRHKTQDATSITSLTWGEADKSVLTPIVLYNPSNASPTQKASITYEPVVLTNLATHITQDTALLKELGFHQFVAQRWSGSDFVSLDKVNHPVHRLLKFYKERGAPVKMATKPWL